MHKIQERFHCNRKLTLCSVRQTQYITLFVVLHHKKWKATKEILEVKGQELKSVKYSSLLKEIHIEISTTKLFFHTDPPFLNIGARWQ